MIRNMIGCQPPTASCVVNILGKFDKAYTFILVLEFGFFSLLLITQSVIMQVTVHCEQSHTRYTSVWDCSQCTDDGSEDLSYISYLTAEQENIHPDNLLLLPGN